MQKYLTIFVLLVLQNAYSQCNNSRMEFKNIKYNNLNDGYKNAILARYTSKSQPSFKTGVQIIFEILNSYNETVELEILFRLSENQTKKFQIWLDSNRCYSFDLDSKEIFSYSLRIIKFKNKYGEKIKPFSSNNTDELIFPKR